MQVVDITSEIDVILNVDTITLWSHGRAILLDKGQTTQPAVSCDSVLRLHFPSFYSIQYLYIAVTARREIHAALSLFIGEATVLRKVHIGTRVWSVLTLLSILEDEFTFLVRNDMHHVEIGREEALVLDEVAIVQSSFLYLVCSMRIVNVGIKTTTDVTHLQRAIIILLQMKGDSTILHVHALNSTISVGIPLFCLGYRNLVEDELRR